MGLIKEDTSNNKMADKTWTYFGVLQPFESVQKLPTKIHVEKAFDSVDKHEVVLCCLRVLFQRVLVTCQKAVNTVSSRKLQVLINAIPLAKAQLLVL